MTAAPVLTVYSRRGCHLCEDLLGELEPLLRGRAIVDVQDIDLDDTLRDRYHTRVPVVCAAGQELCQYHLDRSAVLDWLDRAAPR
ncbi:MAG: glutaredoxin family protein [Chromatiales bacterium]|nr:MAG: glutaredoxin family protein [Chromatiales bacterium]